MTLTDVAPRTSRDSRRRPDSNWCTRLCRPLPNHSATAPCRGPWYPGCLTESGVRASALPARQLGASCERPVRLERLEAQVATSPDDRSGSVDESRALLN